MPNAVDEPQIAELRALLDSECELTSRFAALLEEEKQRLAENRIEALSALLEQKDSLVESLVALGGGRETCFARMGAPKEPGKVGAWIESLADAPLLASWQGLLAAARKAQALNAETGQAIALLSRNLQERLDALSPASALLRDHGDLYGPKGKAGGVRGSRFNESV